MFMSTHPHVHAFGLWKETGIPRESSWEKMQMPHCKTLSPEPKPALHPTGVMTDKTESSPVTPETSFSVIHMSFVLWVLTPSSYWSPFLFPFQFPALRNSIHPLFQVSGSEYQRALMLNRSSTRPGVSPFCPLRPDTGVSSLTALAQASALKARLINLLPGRVTEHTNVGPAENPLAILINTHMHERVQ